MGVLNLYPSLHLPSQQEKFLAKVRNRRERLAECFTHWRRQQDKGMEKVMQKRAAWNKAKSMYPLGIFP